MTSKAISSGNTASVVQPTIADRRDNGAVAKLDGPRCARCSDGRCRIESQRAGQSHTKREATFMEFTPTQQSGIASFHDTFLRLLLDLKIDQLSSARLAHRED
jgi:hypothetical protein